MPSAESAVDLIILTDQALLERFVRRHDDTAFAVLVRRHGPMVRATCRRALGDRPDLDDAFQAVFLVLARKAGSIRDGRRLAPWLHMVAVRAALRLRRCLRQRATRERLVSLLPEPAPRPAAEPNDWLDVLDEELRRLPEKLHAALVLCELQGHTRTEAAGVLGVPEGTLSSRLARGRDLLRRRLVRRGVTVSATALTAALTAGAAAAVPPSLTTATTQAATTSAASAGVTAVADGVMRAMFLTKCKAFGLILAATAAAFLGLAWGAGLAPGGGQAGKSDKQLLQGRWRIVSAEIGGKKAPDDEFQRMQENPLVFKGDTVRVRLQSDYKIDPTKNPKEIDITPQEGPENEKGKTFRGIYRLKGDELTLCIPLMPDRDRPTSFTSEEGTLVCVVVLKREK
jgi:RNA polymerase sigma factor (sigma-70 family)